MFTLLYAFTGGADGFGPAAALTPASDLRFYGTTQFGPSGPASNGHGTIFSMTFTGAVTNVHTFTAVDGANPIASIIHHSRERRQFLWDDRRWWLCWPGCRVSFDQSRIV
jgi:hypothetical protein